MYKSDNTLAVFLLPIFLYILTTKKLSVTSNAAEFKINEERRTCKIGTVGYKDFKYKEISKKTPFICLHLLVLIRTKVSMVSVVCVV